jgi:DNA-binding NarL/FixJ family response regulator
LEARFKAGISNLMASLLEALPGMVAGHEYRRIVSRLAEALRAAAGLLDQAVGAEQVAEGVAPEWSARRVRFNAPQLEILRLLDGGHTPQEIAAQLHLVVGTIYWRLGQVNQLLGTHSYRESLLVARDQGLLEV